MFSAQMSAVPGTAAAGAFPGSAGAGFGSSLIPAAGGAAAPAAGGMFANMSPLAQYGLIQGGTSMVGNAVSGYSQGKMVEDQRNYTAEQEEEERQRRNRNQNVGLIKIPGTY
jgi:hypothetical protein